MQANMEIRFSAKQTGVKLWEVAEATEMVVKGIKDIFKFGVAFSGKKVEVAIS